LRTVSREIKCRRKERVQANYYLFMDESRESKEVERRLRNLGITFIRVPERGGILPRLTGPEGVFQGTANILTYFKTLSGVTEGERT
jgi:hypothetical protein